MVGRHFAVPGPGGGPSQWSRLSGLQSWDPHWAPSGTLGCSCSEAWWTRRYPSLGRAPPWDRRHAPEKRDRDDQLSAVALQQSETLHCCPHWHRRHPRLDWRSWLRPLAGAAAARPRPLHLLLRRHVCACHAGAPSLLLHAHALHRRHHAHHRLHRSYSHRPHPLHHPHHRPHRSQHQSPPHRHPPR